MGRVTATVFPPRLNPSFGPNGRHRLDPGSIAECGIILRPGWLPDLTPDQIAWRRDFIPLGQPEPPFRGRDGRPDRWHRWPKTLGAPPRPDDGPCRDGTGFVVDSDDFVVALPRAEILGLTRDELTPAKGPGGVWVTLTHAPQGIALRYPHRLILALTSYRPQSLAGEAEAVAAALGLPPRKSSYSDC